MKRQEVYSLVNKLKRVGVSISSREIKNTITFNKYKKLYSSIKIERKNERIVKRFHDNLRALNELRGNYYVNNTIHFSPKTIKEYKEFNKIISFLKSKNKNIRKLGRNKLITKYLKLVKNKKITRESLKRKSLEQLAYKVDSLDRKRKKLAPVRSISYLEICIREAENSGLYRFSELLRQGGVTLNDDLAKNGFSIQDYAESSVEKLEGIHPTDDDIEDLLLNVFLPLLKKRNQEKVKTFYKKDDNNK